MNLLLDTQIFIWADQDRAKLSPTVQAILSDPLHERYLSVASIWEMQIKVQLGKLDLRLPVQDLISEHVAKGSIHILCVYPEHTYALSHLPSIHRDPFDRLIIATAIVEKAALISADSLIPQYPVQVIW